MAAGELVYVFAQSARVLLERGRAQTSRLAVYRDGVQVVPSSGTYKLFGPSGAELVSMAATFAGDGTAEAGLTAPQLGATLAYGEGYHEEWTLTIAGVVRSFRRMVVLSRFELHPPVSEVQLVGAEYPDLVTNLGNFGQTLQPYIESTWAELLRLLARYGTWADILVEPSDVFDLHRHMVFERVFRSLFKMQEGNERWRELWLFHRDEMRATREGLKVQVDRDRNGLADSLGMESVVKSVHPNVPPRRRMQRPWRW